MNSVLIQSPASVTGIELREILLTALNATNKAYIPRSGSAPGTASKAGKQICQLLYSGNQAQIESDLQNAGLQPHQVVGFMAFDGSSVTTSIESGTLQYLNKRYSDEAQTIEIPPNVNWFPKYQGQSDWIAT